MNHQDLCTVAVKWLKRSQSAGGPGCVVAASELRSGWNGEVPDAIGFRINGNFVISTVVEVKTSRADFHADKAKAHRSAEGMGLFRYFLCPEGLINIADLPDGWGLVWMNKRGHIKVKYGAAAVEARWSDGGKAAINSFEHERNCDREMWLLVRLLSRVGDPEQMNRWIKEANLARNHLAKEVETLRAANKRMTLELMAARNPDRKAA